MTLRHRPGRDAFQRPRWGGRIENYQLAKPHPLFVYRAVEPHSRLLLTQDKALNLAQTVAVLPTAVEAHMPFATMDDLDLVDSAFVVTLLSRG